MILLKIFLSLVIYWAMFNVIAPFAPASFGPLLLTGLAALLSLPLLYVFYRRERDRHGQEARPEYRRQGPSLALILLFGAAASVAVNNLLNLSGLPYLFPGYAENMAPALYAPPLLTQLICTCLLIPAVEELIFRGHAFCLFRDRFGWRTAAFLSALLFGLYHGSVVQGVYAFFLGLGAAWLLQRFGTLLAPWLFHMAANLISVLLEHFSGQLAFLNLLPVFLAETGIALGLAVVCFLGIRGRSAENERPRR